MCCFDRSISNFLPKFKTWNIFFNKLQPQVGKENIRYFLNKHQDDKQTRESLHPYMLYQNSSNYINSNGIKEMNNRGYRNSKDFQDSDSLSYT